LELAGEGNTYEVKIFEKDGHGTEIFKEKDGLEDLLEAFLVKNL